MEKHFPAPDRSRIHRLLGLGLAKKDDKKGKSKNGYDDGASGSSGKRKPGIFHCQKIIFF